VTIVVTNTRINDTRVPLSASEQRYQRDEREYADL